MGEKMIAIETIIDLYKKRLSGEIKSFPSQTWSPYKGGYDNLHRCLRYYFLELLNFNRDDIVTKMSEKLLKKAKLNGGVAILYQDSLRKAMADAFDDLGIKEWDFRGYEWTIETAREALLFEISRLNLDKADITKPRYIEWDNYVFSRVLVWFNLTISNGGILPMLQSLLPEYDFKRSDFDNKSKVKRDPDEAIKEIKRIFEQELKWNENDIREKITLKIVQRYFGLPYRTFGQNIDKMVKAAYPNIGDLNYHKAIPDSVRQEIYYHLVKRDLTQKQISETFNVSISTLANIKKSMS
ncbi:hypothetical protein BC351_00565 [Paenibacillus ferrarius]|uniref:DUF4046 domain-containing protein n=1 Tax=Paenibacillus ferrarius TaxID=1469647 RepID=A0A1V4HSA5_9BACL|nr:DUF4046 domain-containing protein [Paenibacillus ferrarius]OPH61767.1 hypothetical protein BC351_00565 [Paenibacillus ferrarius]